MSMINCPECGKEISDKAKKCVHCGKILIEDKTVTKVCSDCGKENPIDATECVYCGCPFEKETTVEKSVQTIIAEKPKKSLKKIIIPIVVAVSVVAIGLFGYGNKVIKPKNTYNEAIELLDKGKYEEADKLLQSIENYKDVKNIREEIKYESIVYQCVDSFNNVLKNPDSLQIREVVFLGNQFQKGVSDETKNAFKDLADHYDIMGVVMKYSAENGFGGNNTGYVLFVRDNDDYTYFGSSDTLDEAEADDDELEDCKNINIMLNSFEQIGSVDMYRIKTILKNNSYSTIKVIE